MDLMLEQLQGTPAPRRVTLSHRLIVAPISAGPVPASEHRPWPGFLDLPGRTLPTHRRAPTASAVAPTSETRAVLFRR